MFIITFDNKSVLLVEETEVPTKEKNTTTILYLYVCFMVINATFNNISAILWTSVLLVEETGEPGENHRPVTSH